MRIPTWRLVLTGGTVVVLAAAGLGFAAASSLPTSPAAIPAAAAPTAGPDATAKPGGIRALRRARLLGVGRHLVTANVTVTDKNGELLTLQFDHGTVQSIGAGKITIAEAGGTTKTVSTDDATIVRLGRSLGKLADVKSGAEVFVQSRIDGGTTLAKRILVVPATTN